MAVMRSWSVVGGEEERRNDVPPLPASLRSATADLIPSPGAALGDAAEHHIPPHLPAPHSVPQSRGSRKLVARLAVATFLFLTQALSQQAGPLVAIDDYGSSKASLEQAASSAAAGTSLLISSSRVYLSVQARATRLRRAALASSSPPKTSVASPSCEWRRCRGLRF